MGSEIFRQKNLKSIQSPDNLKEYIRVINPGLWIILVAVLLLLTGAFIWGYFGSIEERVEITAVSNNGSVVCEYHDSVQKGMKVVIDGMEGSVSSVSRTETSLVLSSPLPDGVYSGYIVISETHPISFVFN